eukprot:6560368-Prymnesium_polylepis.1
MPKVRRRGGPTERDDQTCVNQPQSRWPRQPESQPTSARDRHATTTRTLAPSHIQSARTAWRRGCEGCRRHVACRTEIAPAPRRELTLTLRVRVSPVALVRFASDDRHAGHRRCARGAPHASRKYAPMLWWAWGTSHGSAARASLGC